VRPQVTAADRAADKDKAALTDDTVGCALAWCGSPGMDYKLRA
jgi:hypothetical protein